MKREYNKGGRPVIGEDRKQKYVVSTRLDRTYYNKLIELATASGCQPSDIVRQLIGRG